MISNRFSPSAEELELLSQVGEKLVPYCDGLAASWQEVLEATSAFHEHLISPEELSRISQQGTAELVEALQQAEMYCMPEAVREHGQRFAHQGLGDKSLVESVSAWQELCLPLVIQIYENAHEREQALIITAKALNGYAALFTEGFLEASRDRILDAQNEMIIALEQSLRESEQWLATTLKSIGDGVITTDTKGLITFMNPVAEILTGWTQKEATKKPLAEVFYIINEETRERCRNPFRKILETGGIVGLANNTVLVAKDGTERIIADSGAPIRDEDTILGTVLVFRDITEKRKMEDDILRLQTEKLESINILAGGIAHDFNNILTAILGNITIAKMHANAEDKSYKLLTEAEKASLRAKNLTQQLLTFSMGGAPVKKPTSISELLTDTAEFALSGSKARCEFCIPEDLWPIEVDAGQISQVINNVIINADQAMPEGGIIRGRAENVVVGQEDGLPLQNGSYVRISIKDEGIGIPVEHLPRVFDPYFSTKQKGSGLGLAISHSIIKNHEGHITVESALGAGTAFYIYLPASQKELTVKKKEIEKAVRGKGRILLMDDEESILEVTSEALQYLGYTVEAARDGEEALDLYVKASKREPFDVVIMDLTIQGGLGGKETMQKLIEIDPEVKAIIYSGYSNDPVMAHYREYGFKGVMIKPYTIKELSKTLQKVLQE